MTTSAGPAQPAPKRASPGEFDRRIVAGYVLAMLVALPCLLLFATERYTLLARLLAWIGLSFSLLPLMIMLAWPRSRMNCLAALGLIIALFYHLAPFHERTLPLRWGQARITDSSMDSAMFLAAMTMPALWLGWLLMGLLPARSIPRLRLEIPGPRLRLAGYFIVCWSLLAAVLWTAGVLNTSLRTTSVINLTIPLEMGFAMLIVHRQRYRDTRLDRALFVGLFLAAGVVALARGVLLQIVQPFIVYIIGSLYLLRRVRVLPLALAFVAVLIMQPVKGEFRQRVWDRQVDMSIADRAELYVELIGEHWLGDAEQVDSDESVNEAASRVGASLALANVVELTPATVPHQWGATLQYLVYAFVPRVFYPNKPIAQYADVWAAVMYGYTTSKGTSHVMIGLSQVAESYINFGMVGALLWLMMTGAVYRVLDEMLGHKDAGSGALALYLYLVQAVMVCFEGSFAQFFGGLIQLILFYGLVLAVLGRLNVAVPHAPRFHRR